MSDDKINAVASLAKEYGISFVLLISVLFVYFNPSDQSEFRKDQAVALAAERAQVQFLQKEVSLLNDRLREVEKQNERLQVQMVLLQSDQDSYPWPAWLKDTSGKVLYANAAYEKQFLIPRGYTLNDYVGKTDYAVWPKEIADIFASNDRAVIDSGQLQLVTEPVIEGSVEIDRRFIKYTRELGGVVIGVSGKQIP